MPILSAKGLGRFYAAEPVFRGVSFVIEEGERLGLVGRNGSGKTTLARIVAGLEPPDEGERIVRSGLTVGYLDQEPTFEPETRAVDAVLEGLSAWTEAVQRHAEVSDRIAQNAGPLGPLLSSLAQAEADVQRLGGWDRQHVAEAMLGQLGIDDGGRPVGTMSGGERRRVALARILVGDVDIAILDEPTNHLDIATIEWLELWLSSRFRGALLLVTHDRYLLDRVTTRTLELERGTLSSYEGGWARFLAAKTEQKAFDERVEANRRNFLRRELEWLRRQPKARGTRQKARVERIQAVLDRKAPGDEKAMELEMGVALTGKTVIETEDVTVELGGRRLVDSLTLRLSRGERIGVIGPNGCGKTTLIRVLTGRAEPTTGIVRLGKNTRIAYLDQERSVLEESKTVFDNVAQGGGRVQVGGQDLDVRTYLERFLFAGDEQRRVVATLSGGEKARVALARILRADANVVVLDEPTNDLDAMTLAALENAVLEFAGTVLVVTHDRWFLDRVATAVLVFENGVVTRHEGGYSDFVARRSRVETPTEDRTPAVRAANAPSPGGKKALTYGEELELEGLLDKVGEAERAVERLIHDVSQADFYERPEAEQREAFEQLEQARAMAESLIARWTELEERRQA